MLTLYFIGGVYGAGKSTFCETLSPMLPAEHLKASDLVRFAPNAKDRTGKATSEVLKNQERLLAALAVRRRLPGVVLLDGHFCLLDEKHAIVRLPVDVFARMQPAALVLVEATLAEVTNRVSKRDGKHLDPGLIEKLADSEREHAFEVSHALGIPIMTVDASTDPDQILVFLRGLSRAH